MPLFVIRDFFGQLRDEVWTLRARADKVHLAFQDVPELRNLVDANLASDAAEAGGAMVAFSRPEWSFLFRVNSHRAKLRQGERAAVFAAAFLLVKDRTTRFEFDQNRGDDDDRQREDRADQSGQPVHGGARESGESLLPSRAGKDQPRRAKQA